MALRDTVVLVTGASRGIGRAVVEALATEGALVYAMARSEELLQELEQAAGARPLPGDVTDPRAVDGAYQRILEETGEAPAVVVNSAGVFEVATIEETALEVFDRQLEVNLRGAFLVTRGALAGMKSRGSGLIINIGSVAGRRAFPGNGAYSASKFGVRGLHEVLIEELRGTGVRATLLEPGACDTPIWDPLDPDSREDLPPRSAMLRPEDVAAAVLFLATRPGGVQIQTLPIEQV